MQKLSQNKIVKSILKDVNDNMENAEIVEKIINQEIISESIEKNVKKITKSQKCADKIAKFVGSWVFIGIYIVFLIAWIVLNVLLVTQAFDPYPFILLNLFLSCIAALQAPVIMISQNRQSERDRANQEIDYKVNLKSEILITSIFEKLEKLNKSQQELYSKINELLNKKDEK